MDDTTARLDSERMYRDVLYALGVHARAGGTAIGAAVVVKRIAREHGLEIAEQQPLPGMTREERENARWERRKDVAKHRKTGMSALSIAAAIGVSPTTVQKDLRTMGLRGQPAKVTTKNGRTYPSTLEPAWWLIGGPEQRSVR